MAATPRTCSTSATAFASYGIGDGSGPIHRTYYRLGGDRRAMEVSPALLDELTDAFRVAFVRGATDPVVPEAVEAAIDDARGATAHEFLGREPDLRYDLLPAFYRATARFYCRYLGAGADWVDR